MTESLEDLRVLRSKPLNWQELDDWFDTEQAALPSKQSVPEIAAQPRPPGQGAEPYEGIPLKLAQRMERVSQELKRRKIVNIKFSSARGTSGAVWDGRFVQYAQDPARRLAILEDMTVMAEAYLAGNFRPLTLENDSRVSSKPAALSPRVDLEVIPQPDEKGPESRKEATALLMKAQALHRSRAQEEVLSGSQSLQLQAREGEATSTGEDLPLTA